MKTGIWIDHEKAVVVSLTDGENTTKVIHSDVKKHGKSGNSADDTSLNVFNEHLKGYYEKVISYLREAEAVYIIGPGEAKGELKKQMEKDNLDKLITGVETADSMTDPQAAEKIKAHFLHHGAARILPD
jgi:hypothetical protein